MKNKVCVITIAFILAITSAACEPSEKPAESLHPELTVQTTTTASQASITTFVQSSTPTVTTTATPPSTTQTKESSESETQATTQPQETSEIEELTPLLTDEDFTFANDFGITMDIRDADLIWGSGDYVKPEEMFKENHYIVIYNQFTYLTKSLGVSYNSLDDSYDFETGVFDVEVPEQNYEWFKVYTGDKFGSLTVEEVSVDYDYFEGKVYDADLRVQFSGKITVTGLIKYDALNVTKSGKGSILLLVDGETWGDIPIIFMKYETGVLKNSNYWDTYNGLDYSSDIRPIGLGNIYTDYEGMDLSAIPADGSFGRVIVTITDLEMWRRTRSDGGRYNAKIESISLLDE